MTDWAVRAVLATGWQAPLIALGTLGAAVMGLAKAAAWARSLPGRARHAVLARHARRKHIRELERYLERILRS